MAPPLEQYLEQNRRIEEMQESCSITVGEGDTRVYIGPTRKGGVVLDFGQPSGGTPMAVARLRNIRDAITEWLIVVAGDPRDAEAQFWKLRHDELQKTAKVYREELSRMAQERGTQP